MSDRDLKAARFDAVLDARPAPAGLAGELAGSLTTFVQPVQGVEKRNGGGRRKLDISIETLEGLFRGSPVIVDTNGRVEHLSSRAAQLLRGDVPFAIRNGAFHIERGALQRRLMKQLHAFAPASPGPTGHEGPELLGIPDFTGHTRYVLRVVPLPAMAGTRLVILVIEDLLRQGGVQRNSLVSLFGMSQREAELAELFARGLRIDDIAEEMRISPNTARVHLRNVFSKTNCSSQVELARLMVLIP